MHKIKNFLGSIGITFLFWTFARYIPSVIGTLYPDYVILKLIAYVVFLTLGWMLSKKLSKGEHLRCIRINLYIFAILEISGLITSVTYLIQSLQLSSGRYTTDIHGIPYTNYVMIYGMLLIWSLVYIILCFKLASKTHTIKQEVIPMKTFVFEKNHEKKQELRDQITKLEKELKETEETYEKNKILLAESFSDAALQQMVHNGQCSVDQAEDYKQSRIVLELLVATRPTERKSILWSIDVLRKELNELEQE